MCSVQYPTYKVQPNAKKEIFGNIYKNWTDDKESLMIKLMATQQSDIRYLENANIILELVKIASQRFKSTNSDKKRID